MLRIIAICLGLGAGSAALAHGQHAAPMKAAVDSCASARSLEMAGNALIHAGWTPVPSADLTEPDLRALGARNLTYRAIDLPADPVLWPQQWQNALHEAEETKATPPDPDRAATWHFRHDEGFLLLRIDTAARATLLTCELVLTDAGIRALAGARLTEIPNPDEAPVYRVRDAKGAVRGNLDFIVLQSAWIARILNEPFPYAALLRIYAEVPLEEL